MSERDNGGPAFPIAGSERGPERAGTSLRDWFAGQVLDCLTKMAAEGRLPEIEGMTNGEVVSAEAYMLADAMLEARK